MKYEIGEKVRVRRDLNTYKEYGDGLCCAEPQMVELKGQIVEIETVYGDSYDIKEDNCKFAWTDDMFEDEKINNTYINASMITPRYRGFEVVVDKYRVHSSVNIELPVRGDSRSAGYDIKTPVKITLQPNEKKLVFTDIKAYMLSNEVLEIHVRSSVGVNKGVILSNITGIIDSSYYNNPKNDGNIGLTLWNTSDKEVTFEAQERICQGIFKSYLISDDDVCLKDERTGGFGSSGK